MTENKFRKVASSSVPVASLLIGGAFAIALQTALGAFVIGFLPDVWMGAVFLLGVPLGVWVTRNFSALAFPAIGVLALTPTSSGLAVDAPLFGRVVSENIVEVLRDDPFAAGFPAQGWRIDLEHVHEERVSYGRRNPTSGSIRVAPLLPDRWKAGEPVEVWIAGVLRDSGRILPSNPQFWSEPDGEYVRLLGADFNKSQRVIDDAAKKFGLDAPDAPIIVTRTSAVSTTIENQARAIMWSMRVSAIAWLMFVAGAWAILRWRNRKRG